MPTLEEGCDQIAAVLRAQGLFDVRVQRVCGKCMFISVQVVGMYVWETPEGDIYYSPHLGEARKR
jgi:hypothetical protein